MSFTAFKKSFLLSIGETGFWALSQLSGILVSLSFSPAGRAGLVFQCELIQVSAPFFFSAQLPFAIRDRSPVSEIFQEEN